MGEVQKPFPPNTIKGALLFIRMVPGVPLSFQNWILRPIGVEFKPWLYVSVVAFTISAAIWIFGADAVVSLLQSDGSILSFVLLGAALLTAFFLKRKVSRSG